MKTVPCTWRRALTAPSAASAWSSASLGDFLHDHEYGVDTRG